jgi:hypothetical protein
MDTDTIEGYLIRAGTDYETVAEGMWVVHDEVEHVENIVVNHAEPVVLFRVKLMDLPSNEAQCAKLCKKLLELNAAEMISGAYGIEGESVVAIETLQSENLDYNEFQAAIDGLTLAITDHYEDLKGFHTLEDE